MKKYTYTELITNLGVGFELPIIWATSVTANQAAVFVLDRIFTGYVRVDYGP